MSIVKESGLSSLFHASIAKLRNTHVQAYPFHGLLCALRILFRNLAISQEKGTFLYSYKT